MSSKTRTSKAGGTIKPTGSVLTLRPVSDQPATTTDRTGAEDKLWEALHANPNSTAADLSVAAEIGKSTAPKILAKWADEGSVTRIAGIAQGGRRAADLWVITAADVTQNNPVPAEAPAAADHDVTSAAGAESDTFTVPVARDSDDTTAAENNATDPADTQPVDTDTVDTESTVEKDEDTPDTADDVTGAVQAGSVVPDTGPASADGAAPDDDQATASGGADAAGKKAARLPSGALRGMVEDFLRERPGEAFGPSAIAEALGGKSSGAVSNALDKLVGDGIAVKTGGKPRRFALAPAQQEAAPTPAN